MSKTKLKGGLEISKITTGLWQIADMERKGPLNPKQTAPYLQPYYEKGLTTFDMADHYGSAEIIAGEFRKRLDNPQSVQLLTKWVPPAGKISQEKTREAVMRALKRMQMDQIDLLQYHAWNYLDPAWLDQLFGLQSLKQEGLIRSLGVTNFDADHLKMALDSGIELETNQICFSVLDQRAQSKMLATCQSYDVQVLAFGTLAGGFISEKWLNKPEPHQQDLTTWSQMKYKRFIDAAGGWSSYQLLLDQLYAIAQKNQVSIANVATRYILDQPGVGSVIIGARLGESSHLDDNVHMLNGSLTPEDHQTIKDQLAQLRPIPFHCGDEYRKEPFLTASGDLSHHIDQMPVPYSNMKERGITRITSGTPWEKIAGFSRAVRKGNQVWISGTTATHGDQLIGGPDPASQMLFVLDKIEAALISAGARLADVIRTRVYILRMEDWEIISRLHGERFAEIQPANTMIRADLIGDGYLVEMEAEALIQEYP